MKSIEELQHDLKKIYNELEEIKNNQCSNKKSNANFNEIAAKAKRYPISGHPMRNEDEHTRQMYLLMLLSVAELDVEKYPYSYGMIYRIAYGMEYSGDIQELALIAKQMNFERLDECTHLFDGSNLRLLLVLDCILTAGCFEKGKKEAFEYISQLCILLKVNKDEVTFLANTARAILTRELSEYKCNIPNTYDDLFNCYLGEFEDKFKVEIKYISIDTKIVENNQSLYLKEVKVTSVDSNKMILDVTYIDTPMASPLGSFGIGFAVKEERKTVVNNIQVQIYDDFTFINWKENFCFDPYSFSPNKKYILDYSEKKNANIKTLDIPIAVISNTPLAYKKAIELYSEIYDNFQQKYNSQERTVYERVMQELQEEIGSSKENS